MDVGCKRQGVKLNFELKGLCVRDKGVFDLWYFWPNINILDGVFWRLIYTGVLSMAEPPNLVLQVNVSRSTLPVCIILFGGV